MNYETLNTVLYVLCGQWMWKSREINCVLHLVIMYLSQKGKREHNSISTLTPWLPSSFSLVFFLLLLFSVEPEQLE